MTVVASRAKGSSTPVPARDRLQNIICRGCSYYVAAILIAGTVLSLSLWYTANHSQSQRIDARLDRASELRHALLSVKAADTIQALQSLGSFIAITPTLTDTTFTKLIQQQQLAATTLDSLHWIPRSVAASRSSGRQSEERKRLSDQASLPSILDLKRITPSVPAEIQDQIGADYATLEASLRTGMVRSSAPYVTVNVPNAPSTIRVLLYLPVFSADSQPGYDSLRGFLVGVLQPLKLINQAFTDLPHLLLQVKASQGATEITYSQCADQKPHACDPVPALHRNLPLNIANTIWTMQYTPTKSYLDEFRTAYPAIVGLASLLLTFSTAFYLCSLTRRHKAIVSSNEQYHRLVQSVSDYAIYSLDKDGFITTWNSGAEQIKGYSDAEVIGKHFRMFYPKEAADCKAPENALITALKSGRFEEESIRIRKDGSMFWVNVVITPMFGNDGSHVGFSKVTRDISERKQAETKIEEQYLQLKEARNHAEKLREAAERATEVKSQFVAYVSHEIRTPLTSIIGFTEEVLTRLPESSEHTAQLNVVIRNAHHLLRLINDILDFSKIEAGKLDLDIREVSLLDIVDEVSLLMMPRARQKGIEFIIEKQFPLPALIRTDSTRFKQIVLNLVDNALKFTREGFVHISLEWAESEKKITINVRDSGIGISPEKQRLIFTSFGQGDASVNREFGGTGLGLYISKRLANELGGDITLASVPGQGSTFTATIVAEYSGTIDAEVARSARPKLADFRSDRAFKGRVLLAEDVVDTQKLLTMILRGHGLEVAIAQDGEEAVAKGMGEKFDLIFMDMQMPRMDGLAATQELRAKGFYGPIIALTANVAQARVDKCIGAGCDGCLAKPFERKALSEVLGLYLEPGEHPLDADAGQSFEKTAEHFRHSFSSHLTRLRRAWERRDFQFVKSSAHALAGAAAFAYPAVCKPLGRLENAAQAKEEAACSQTLLEIESLHQQELVQQNP